MGTNPYMLFLILILLLLSTDKNADAKLTFLKDFTEKTAQSLDAVRQGIETMHSGIQEAYITFAGTRQEAIN